MINKTITEAVLKLLLASDGKAPVPFKVIKHYLKESNTPLQMYNCLERLYANGYISIIGTRRRYRYSITEKGLDYLKKPNRKEFLKQMNSELSKYIQGLDQGEEA